MAEPQMVGAEFCEIQRHKLVPGQGWAYSK